MFLRSARGDTGTIKIYWFMTPIRKVVDSIETYRIQQLEKLRENYNQQRYFQVISLHVTLPVKVAQHHNAPSSFLVANVTYKMTPRFFSTKRWKRFFEI